MGSKYIMYMTLGTKSWVKIFMPSYHKNPLSLNPFVSPTSPAMLTWHINLIVYSVLSCLYPIRFSIHCFMKTIYQVLPLSCMGKTGFAFIISSPELKVQVSCLLSVIVIVVNFTFSSSSPEPLGQFQPNLAQSILRWRGFKFVQIKGPALL